MLFETLCTELTKPADFNRLGIFHRRPVEGRRIGYLTLVSPVYSMKFLAHVSLKSGKCANFIKVKWYLRTYNIRTYLHVHAVKEKDDDDDDDDDDRATWNGNEDWILSSCKERKRALFRVNPFRFFLLSLSLSLSLSQSLHAWFIATVSRVKWAANLYTFSVVGNICALVGSTRAQFNRKKAPTDPTSRWHDYGV